MVKLEDFIGCTIEKDLTNTTLNISQPDLINKMTQGFNVEAKSLMSLNTPAIPHKGVVRNQETNTKISDDLQKRYRSGVGSLIYLVKHARPELSNAVCELYKCIHKANMSHYKPLLREIKFVIHTKDYFY